MPIQYSLRENHLTSDPDDFLATVQSVGTYTLDDIIEQMIQMGSTLTKEDALAAMEAHYKAIIAAVQAGYNVITPSVNYGASMRGVFNGLTDNFDPSRHSIEAIAVPGKTLREAMSKASVQKQEGITPTPNPEDFYDFGSSTRNGIITPGNGGRITGHRLKFDPADPEQGVFFIGDNDAVRISTIMSNKAGELIFLIPTLPAGEYRLEVRASFGSTTRSGLLRYPLTVPA